MKKINIAAGCVILFLISLHLTTFTIDVIRIKKNSDTIFTKVVEEKYVNSEIPVIIPLVKYEKGFGYEVKTDITQSMLDIIHPYKIVYVKHSFIPKLEFVYKLPYGWSLDENN